MTLRHFLALDMAVFLAWNSIPAPPAVLGVVAGSDRAHLNNAAVSEEQRSMTATTFQPRRGMLLLRGEATTLGLPEESTVIVRCGASGAQSMEAELGRGTLVFSATRAAALEIAAEGGLIRPAEDARTVGQVSIVSPKELRVYARRGSLQFSYRGEMRTIAEGKSYQVILDPSEDDPGKKKAPKRGLRRKTFVFVAIGSGAAGAAVMIFENHRHKQMESPDLP